MIVGLIVLHQVPGPAGVVGICFVVAAGIGAARSGARHAGARQVRLPKLGWSENYSPRQIQWNAEFSSRRVVRDRQHVFVGSLDAPVVGPFVRPWLWSRSATSVVARARHRTTGGLSAVGRRRSSSALPSPDTKTWWRNFLGDGGPITLLAGRRDRTGARGRQPRRKGRVSVTVALS